MNVSGLSARRPAAEIFLAQLPGLRFGDITCQHQRRALRRIVARPEVRQIVASRCLHRLRRADVAIPVRIVSVERLHPHAQRRCDRLIALLQNRRQPLLADALDLGALERRMQRHVGQQRHRPIHAVAQRAYVHERRIHDSRRTQD